jgi:hypothetical protein
MSELRERHFHGRPRYSSYSTTSTRVTISSRGTSAGQ